MKYLRSILFALTLFSCSSTDEKYDYSEVESVESSSEKIYSNQNQSQLARQITAGEHRDIAAWENWLIQSEESIFNEIGRYWQITPNNRIHIKVIDSYGDGLSGINVELRSRRDHDLVWVQKTDVKGECQLFWSIEAFDSQYNVNDFYVVVDGMSQSDKLQLASNGGNVFRAKNSKSNRTLQIAFMVDATGSMGDEIQFLKDDLQNVINKVSDVNQSTSLEIGCVFYRDRGDEYLTRISDLSNSIPSTVSFIDRQGAAGGGDYPEAVDIALSRTVNDLSWSRRATKIAFLLLDAPPHKNKESMVKLETAVRNASKNGIKLIPISASGINKNTEYLLRSMAILTNGTYCYITDDSGIGNAHISPDIDKVNVEYLNDILVRLILENMKEDYS